MLLSHSHQPVLTSRPVGTYRITLEATVPLRTNMGLLSIAYCHVYRNDVLLTTVRAADERAAVSEARRNVRNARKAGGL